MTRVQSGSSGFEKAPDLSLTGLVAIRFNRLLIRKLFLPVSDSFFFFFAIPVRKTALGRSDAFTKHLGAGSGEGLGTNLLNLLEAMWQLIYRDLKAEVK